MMTEIASSSTESGRFHEWDMLVGFFLFLSCKLFRTVVWLHHGTVSGRENSSDSFGDVLLFLHGTLWALKIFPILTTLRPLSFIC